MTDLSVSIEVSTSSNGTVRFRASDRASGEVVLSLDGIDPAEFWLLLQGRVQTHSAFVTSHPDRLGRERHVITRSLGRIEARHDSEEEEALVLEATADARRDLFTETGFLWEPRYTRRTNRATWDAVFDRWEDA